MQRYLPSHADAMMLELPGPHNLTPPLAPPLGPKVPDCELVGNTDVKLRAELSARDLAIIADAGPRDGSALRWIGQNAR